MNLTPSDYKDIWIHQSKLMWSRLQTLTVVNFAIFGAWWKFEIEPVLWFGAVFNFLVFLAIFRDSQYMNWVGRKMKIPKMKGLKGACVAMIISVGLSVLNIVLAADIIHMERPQEPSKEPTEKELKKIESGLVEIDRKIEFLMEFQKKSIEIQLDIDCPLSTLDVEEQSEAEVEPVDGSN